MSKKHAAKPAAPAPKVEAAPVPTPKRLVPFYRFAPGKVPQPDARTI
jgi:hypothetical protein